MGAAELISWISLGTAFAGVCSIFTTNRALRRPGILAMGTGLTIFCLAGLYTVLHDSLAESPLYPFLAVCTVLMAVIISSWLTRYFYRSFNLYSVEALHLSDSEQIPR